MNKKVLLGLALLVSFSLSACSNNDNNQATDKSNSSSLSRKKAKSASSKKQTSSSKKESEQAVALDQAKDDVDNLFTDNKHTKLEPIVTKSLISDTNKTVAALPDSNKKSKLEGLIKVAYKLYPALAASISSSNANSKSESLASSEASSKKVAKQEAKDAQEEAETAKSSTNSRYKKVSLSSFATNPEKYEGSDIQTSGHVTYIQKNPDDENVYYVVILPKDKYSSSGYSYGSVVEVNIDSMQESPIHEGDNITVQGGAMTSMLELNGETLRSDIVVDNVTVN